MATFLVGLGTIGLSYADDKDEGGISLFNGKDLTGWKASEGVEWTVEEGTIVTPPKRSHLFTDEEYKNFEYKVDCMTTPGSNSGLYVHTKYQDSFPDAGYEVQVNQTQGANAPVLTTRDAFPKTAGTGLPSFFGLDAGARTPYVQQWNASLQRELPSRVLLEAAALLHDTGHMIGHRGHHKHGEYLALNGDVPGLEGRDRAIVAALVRYHNRKSEPAAHHAAYSTLSNADRRITRRLAAILRIAEALDHSHRQHILKLRTSFQRGAVGLQVSARGDAAEDLRDANRSAELFEKEFHVRVYFRQSQTS
jgi:hypothetical protein